MPKIFHLHIENFRGIDRFDHTFNDGLTCIIGRGDSGKTTILDAISYALTPQHTLPLHDGDFYNCNIEQPIVIEVTLIGLTEEILRKFGDRIRGVKDKKIISSMADPEAREEGVEDAVTIRLKVEKDLETVWEVIGDDGVEPRIVRASERELFNCFYISEYNDRHFTLSKGTPLSSLFRQKAEKKSDVLNAELIAQLGRDAKQGFENAIGMQDVFNDVISAIIKNASEIGISTGEVKASIDQREFLLKDNKIALHHNNVPLRQLGKGSKRLLSLAIQLSLTDPSGIILIDEIEQGLEPDRVHQVCAHLLSKSGIQVVMTTHSQHVVEELKSSNLFIKTENNCSLKSIDLSLQGLVRKHPMAFFAKSILVGEGATEYGFIRGVNEYRQSKGKKSLSFHAVCAINGNGNECVKTAEQLIDLGYRVCLFCDSDVTEVNNQKENLQNKGVTIIDCEDSLALESQIFKDCSWDTIKKLIEYRIDCNQTSKGVFENIKPKLKSPITYSDDWYEHESNNLRTAISEASGNSKNPWFKKIEMGYDISLIILKDVTLLTPTSRMFTTLDNLSKWIEMG